MSRPVLLHVVGARPNFPKLAPVYLAAHARGVPQCVVHTGQHYDAVMSDDFFRDLGIPAPEVVLGVGSGSHAVQTARILERLERVLLEQRPEWTVVYGDINSTMAAAIVASKLGIRVAHVEAGLRSDDRSMPEELNRLVTDRLSDLLLTPSHDAGARLQAEGEPAEKIVLVGNVMIDTLRRMLPRALARDARARYGVEERFLLVTLHRPSNVDDPQRLRDIAAALRALAATQPVLFPAHPRTRERLTQAGIDLGEVRLLPPIEYLDLLALQHDAAAVITDSGGIQEETTVLGVPCFTLRPNTERPITISEGTNTLVPDPAALPALVAAAPRERMSRVPEGWDGHAGERVVEALLARLARGGVELVA